MNTLPSLTQMQISDVLQEFLCIPDQLKLIEFDHWKFKVLERLNFQDFKEYDQNIQKLRATIINNKKGSHRLNLLKDFEQMIRNLDTDQSGSISWRVLATCCILLNSTIATEEDIRSLQASLDSS